jgi:HAD superfamily hydrolase (TIGR01457 family)
MQSRAERYDAFLLDLDGVLYRGGEQVPGAAEAVARLRELGKGIAFVTNNSARTPRAVADALVGAGVRADPTEVETSALTTASLLAERGVDRVFVIGEEGIRSALAARDIVVVEDGRDAVQAVVIGWDRAVDYEAFRTASLLVERGATLVATNADASYPASDGRWPGAGALLAVVETTTGVAAEVVGKPNAPIFWAALERAGGGRPLVIGDRLDTDIAGAISIGWDSLLVLTGIATKDDLGVASPTPTYVGDDLSALFAPA